MFPELNNLLNTSPDRVEQVISSAVRKGRVPGAWRKHRPRGQDTTFVGRLCLGVVVQGGLSRDLG